MYTSSELQLAAIRKDPERFNLHQYTKPTGIRLVAIELKNFQAAITMATKFDEPNRLPLYTLYERALFDDAVESAVENRIGRVQQSRFRWVSETDNKQINEELTRQFEKMWFFEWIRYAMESRFWGHSLIEVSAIDAKGEIEEVKLVNRRHVKAIKGMVAKEESDSTGTEYRIPPYSLWNFEFGDPKQLGILAKIIPFVALKTMNTGAWGIHNEKFGMPIRTAKTQNTDKKRLDQLAQMLEDMGIDMWAVLQGDEELELIVSDKSGSGHLTYEAFWNKLDNAIARMILGNDATISTKDNTGTYASISKMAELQEYRHWNDKTLLQHWVNQNRDKFSLFGYKVDGYKFEWDEFEEMPVKDMIDAIPKIAPYAQLDWAAIREKTGIPIIGEKQTPEASDPLGKK